MAFTVFAKKKKHSIAQASRKVLHKLCLQKRKGESGKAEKVYLLSLLSLLLFCCYGCCCHRRHRHRSSTTLSCIVVDVIIVVAISSQSKAENGRRLGAKSVLKFYTLLDPLSHTGNDNHRMTTTRKQQQRQRHKTKVNEDDKDKDKDDESRRRRNRHSHFYFLQKPSVAQAWRKVPSRVCASFAVMPLFASAYTTTLNISCIAVVVVFVAVTVPVYDLANDD